MEGGKWKKKIVIVNLQTTLLIILLINQWIQSQEIHDSLIQLLPWLLISVGASIWRSSLLLISISNKTYLSLSLWFCILISLQSWNYQEGVLTEHAIQFCIRRTALPPLPMLLSCTFGWRCLTRSLVTLSSPLWIWLCLDSPLHTWAKNRNINKDGRDWNSTRSAHCPPYSWMRTNLILLFQGFTFNFWQPPLPRQ